MAFHTRQPHAPLQGYARKLRKSGTRAEAMLWNILKNRKFLGLKFRRQVPIDFYIVDFLCSELRLIIEIDGSSHDRKYIYDQRRTSYLKSCGYILLRFGEIDVQNDLDGVLASLKHGIDLRKLSL